MNRYRPASGPVSFAVIMSQLPELDPGAISICVLRSATVRWLHFEFASVIGVDSSGPSTGSAGAELVSGLKLVNLVLMARTGRPARSTSPTVRVARFDMCERPLRVHFARHRAARSVTKDRGSSRQRGCRLITTMTTRRFADVTEDSRPCWLTPSSRAAWAGMPVGERLPAYARTLPTAFEPALTNHPGGPRGSMSR